MKSKLSILILLISFFISSCTDKNKALDNNSVLGTGNSVIQHVIIEDGSEAFASSGLASGETATAEYGVKTNLSSNWIEFTDSQGHSQRFTFKNNSGPTYKITFTLVTKLKKSEFDISDYFYEQFNGAATPKKEGISEFCNDYYAIKFSITTSTKQSTGKFTIIYKKK